MSLPTPSSLAEDRHVLRKLGLTLVALALVPWFVIFTPPPGMAPSDMILWSWETPGFAALPWLIAASGAALAIICALRRQLDARVALIAAGAVGFASLGGFFLIVEHAAATLGGALGETASAALSVYGVLVMIALVAGARLRALAPRSPIARALLLCGALGLGYGSLWPQTLPVLDGVEQLVDLAGRGVEHSDQIPWLHTARTLPLYLDDAFGSAGKLLALMTALSLTLPGLAALAAWCALAPARGDASVPRPPAGVAALRVWAVGYGPALLGVMLMAMFVAQGILALMLLAMASAFATWLAAAGHGLALGLAALPARWSREGASGQRGA